MVVSLFLLNRLHWTRPSLGSKNFKDKPIPTLSLPLLETNWTLPPHHVLFLLRMPWGTQASQGFCSQKPLLKVEKVSWKYLQKLVKVFFFHFFYFSSFHFQFLSSHPSQPSHPSLSLPPSLSLSLSLHSSQENPTGFAFSETNWT